jgi:hypothetical protein
MIPFDLKNLFRNSLLLIFILNANSLFAQQDTIVVYEYIYKTDTVWLESKPARDTIIIGKLQNIEDASLFIDTITKKAELVIFSSGSGATIPIKHIILNENHLKFNKMKKVSFFTMFFLGLQSISFAQPDISVKAGVSQFWFNTFVKYPNGITTGDNEGFELKGPLKLKNFSFSVGCDFHSYYNSINIFFSDNDTVSYTSQTNRIAETFRSFPILIYYKIKRFEFFAG